MQTKLWLNARRSWITCSTPHIPTTGARRSFFEKLGFQRKEWKVLAEAFRTLAGRSEVAQSMKSPHGRKYVIVGRIESSGGKSSLGQTIWIVDSGSEVARLVTAYPHDE